ELFGEVPFNFLRRLDLDFSAGFVERGGAFGQAITDELPILDPNTNTYVHLTRQHTFTASLKYIDVSGGARFTPFPKYAGYIAARIDAGIPAGRSTTFTQTESILSPQGVVYPQTNSTSLTDGQGTISGVNTLFGLTGTLGYEFPIGPAFTAAPELSYYLPLNSVSTTYPWHVASFSAGVALRWNEPPKSAPLPAPPPPPPPPIVKREDPNALAPKISAVSLASEPLHIIETTVTETFPILPYIFFDSAIATIPDRFARLSSNEAAHFSESNLPHRSLESYYQLLNVIGSRMRANPSAILSINGTTDGREGKDEGKDEGGGMKDEGKELAQRRADAVRDYLAEVWNIDKSRLAETTSDAPHNPSSTQYEQGFEENRRVELSSNDDHILAPIVHERFREESALPKSLPISLLATSKIGVRNWHVGIRSHDATIFETSGLGTPPAKLEWNPTEGQVDALAKELGQRDSIQLEFQASAANGAETDQTISLPASKSINPFELSRLSLIVFDFDQSAIDPQNQRMISQFVAKSFYPASSATIVGSTDNLGELAHNQELSTARADNVRDLILADKPEAKITSTIGIGPANLLYDNHLPEGRYYCRTVKVEVATPLESILTGQK
ncbi:MAG: OmpA family protein, partial [Candidatus Kapaibacterium sp.]